ncbi:unnamed protein product [Boreogadus saida]
MQKRVLGKEAVLTDPGTPTAIQPLTPSVVRAQRILAAPPPPQHPSMSSAVLYGAADYQPPAAWDPAAYQPANQCRNSPKGSVGRGGHGGKLCDLSLSQSKLKL